MLWNVKENPHALGLRITQGLAWFNAQALANAQTFSNVIVHSVVTSWTGVMELVGQLEIKATSELMLCFRLAITGTHCRSPQRTFAPSRSHHKSA